MGPEDTCGSSSFEETRTSKPGVDETDGAENVVVVILLAISEPGSGATTVSRRHQNDYRAKHVKQAKRFCKNTSVHVHAADQKFVEEDTNELSLFRN